MRALKAISDKFVHFLLEEHIIDASKIEFYQYGFELLAASVLDVAWILLLGLLLGQFFTALVYVLILITVRTQIGGFHANTYFSCFLCYTVFFGAVLAAAWLCAEIGITMAGLSILSCMLLLVLYFKAPVPHTRQLTEAEKGEARKKGIGRTVIWLAFMLGIGSFRIKYAYSIFSVLFVSVILMIVEAILQQMKKRRSQ